MLVHKLYSNTGKTKALFEAEFDLIRKDKAEFVGEYGDKYRLAFPDQEELKEFIEELIELYNSREEQ